MEYLKTEIATVAARMVVEEGLDYGAAKRRALRQLGLSGRVALPNNTQLERAVQEYIAIFCADTQASELRTLRLLGLAWMERLEPFRPYICGAVWHGTATRHTDIYLELFCDDPKSAEIGLIDMHVAFQSRIVPTPRGKTIDALSVHVFCADLGEYVGLHLLIYDYDELRAAPRTDVQGRCLRGDATALRNLLQGVHTESTRMGIL
ncbi:MAG: hypothetical protein IPH35_17150 [Rhodoferax sp.]|nr:hypothetical protein [Rhodoferax sp.]